MNQDNRKTTPAQGMRVLGARRTQMRVMHRKSQGIVAVYEQDPTVVDAGRTLIFETPAQCTRIEQFPAQWQLLSDEELIKLQRRT